MHQSRLSENKSTCGRIEKQLKTLRSPCELAFTYYKVGCHQKNIILAPTVFGPRLIYFHCFFKYELISSQRVTNTERKENKIEEKSIT